MCSAKGGAISSLTARVSLINFEPCEVCDSEQHNARFLCYVHLTFEKYWKTIEFLELCVLVSSCQTSRASLSGKIFFLDSSGVD